MALNCMCRLYFENISFMLGIFYGDLIRWDKILHPSEILKGASNLTLLTRE